MSVKIDMSSASSPSSSSPKNCRVLVLGLGNALLKDEGLGGYIAARLGELDLPSSVEVIDGGTSALDILLLQKGLYKLIIVDAVRASKEPGTIYKAHWRTDQPGKLKTVCGQEEHSRISLHQVGLLDALALVERIGCAPKEVILIGVEPKEIAPDLGLTEEIKQRVPAIIDTVLQEIKNALYRE